MFKFLLFATFLATVTFGRDGRAPHHSINLDLPPEQRWIEIATKYNSTFQQVMAMFTKKMGKFQYILDKIMHNKDHMSDWLGEEGAAELAGMAKVFNVDIGMLAFYNGVYDFEAHGDGKGLGILPMACSSIVAQNDDGHIYHGRNLDFGASRDIMSNVTIWIDFQRNGTTVISAVTMIGQVGYNTFFKPNKYSFTHDQRDGQTMVANLKNIFGQHRMFSFALFRKIAETTDSFDEALAMAQSPDTKLCTDSYLIFSGVKPTEGAVVTHNADEALDTWRINGTDSSNPSYTDWYVIETNYDHWKPVANGDDRRSVGNSLMHNLGSANVNSDTLFQIILEKDADESKGQRPLCNTGTAYSIIFCAAKPEEAEVTVHYTW